MNHNETAESGIKAIPFGSETAVFHVNLKSVTSPEGITLIVTKYKTILFGGREIENYVEEVIET